MAKNSGSTRRSDSANGQIKSMNINAYDLAKKIVVNYEYNTRNEQRALTSFINMIAGNNTYDKIADIATKISQKSEINNALKKVSVTINPNDLANKMITSYQYNTKEEHKSFVDAMYQVVGDKMYGKIIKIANKIAEEKKIKKL